MVEAEQQYRDLDSVVDAILPPTGKRGWWEANPNVREIKIERCGRLTRGSNKKRRAREPLLADEEGSPRPLPVVTFSDVVVTIPRRRSAGAQPAAAPEGRGEAADRGDSSARDAWYDSEDYGRVIRECDDTVRAAVEAAKLRDEGDDDAADRVLDESKHYLRGLEDFLVPQMSVLRKKRREDVTRFVILQQAVHVRKGRSDPEMIRSLSETISRDSAREALLLGKLDAEIASEPGP